MKEWQQAFDGMQTAYLQGLSEFIAFKSISSNPANEQDCRNCAIWLVNWLKKIGFSVELIETGYKPLIFAEYLPASASKSVLYYGHYDVQPVDPLNLWQSDPFTLTERQGRYYARGAQDNKGQTYYYIKALEHLIAQGKLNIGVRLLIEGEEECGSEGIDAVLDQIADRIKSDYLMVCDTGTLRLSRPAIIMSLRGVSYLNLKLSGPHTDLHSGVHGGMAPNVAQELCKLLASLHDEQGKIAVKNFYDDVPEVTAAELATIQDNSFTDEFYLSEVGVPASGGEKNLAPLIRRGFRPTLEINGIHSGFAGPGTKTIIPAIAECFITSRLVAGQSGFRVLETVKQHLLERVPAGLKLEIVKYGVGGEGCKFQLDSKIVKIAQKHLQEMFNNEPEIMWEGASIPIVAKLANYVTDGSLLVGFGLEEDAIHAPNESFSLEQMRIGFTYACSLLSSL